MKTFKENGKPEKISDPLLGLEKAKKFCAYQERSQQEVRDKLYELGLWPDAIENIITQLIDENFLNEERFACAFARGKFRIKQWGRVKIKVALKQKGVSTPCITKALKEIDQQEYSKVLQKVVQEKLKGTKEKSPIRKRYKVASYAISRGFEPDMVYDYLREFEG